MNLTQFQKLFEKEPRHRLAQAKGLIGEGEYQKKLLAISR